MSEQARYSAQDIDRLRQACLELATPVGRSFKPDEVARTAEAMLVTYMANGTTADELEQHASDVWEERTAAMRREWERREAAVGPTVTYHKGSIIDSRNLRAGESGVYPPRTRLARFLSRLRS